MMQAERYDRGGGRDLLGRSQKAYSGKRVGIR